jgi:hypothetical protein
LIVGLPVVYFFRDNVGLAPNSAIFTIVALLLPFALSLPFKDFRYFEKPNIIAYILLGVFILLSFFYFILRDPYTAVNKNYEYSNLSVIFLMFFSIPFLRDKEIGTNFIKIGLVLSFFGAATLLYAIIKDPFYVIGQRAAIRFGDSEQAGSNPHIFGKAGFFGFVFSLIALKYHEKLKWGILIPLMLLILSIIEIVVTQTMVAILALVLTLFLFAISNFSVKTFLPNILSLLKKWYILLGLAICVFKGVKAYNDNPDFIDPFIRVFTIRGTKLLNSLIPSDDKKQSKATVDESASGRIAVLKLLVENYDEDIANGKLRYLIFGHGYKNIYVDVPHIEVFDSFGLLGFIFYSFLFFYLARLAFRSMRNPQSFIQEFFAYAFVYYFLHNFTGGFIIDYSRLIFYILIARFLKNQIQLPPKVVLTNSKI